MKKKVLGIGFLQFLTTRLLNLSIIFLLGVLAISLSSCALMAHGTSQDILVNSRPPGAEVYLEGELIGKTPMEIKLKRSGSHEITLRYGEQERVVIVKSRADTRSIILDAIPLAIIGGLTAWTCIDSGRSSSSSGGWSFGDYSGLQRTVCVGGILVSLASTTPLIVDGATGAWHVLSPKEVMADFDE